MGDARPADPGDTRPPTPAGHEVDCDRVRLARNRERGRLAGRPRPAPPGDGGRSPRRSRPGQHVVGELEQVGAEPVAAGVGQMLDIAGVDQRRERARDGAGVDPGDPRKLGGAGRRRGTCRKASRTRSARSTAARRRSAGRPVGGMAYYCRRGNGETATSMPGARRLRMVAAMSAIPRSARLPRGGGRVCDRGHRRSRADSASARRHDPELVHVGVARSPAGAGVAGPRHPHAREDPPAASATR